MSWTCPLCGFQNDEATLQCVCGFFADESVLNESSETESSDIFQNTEQLIKGKSLRMDTDMESFPQNSKDKQEEELRIKTSGDSAKKQNSRDDEVLVKEINSWKVTFSKQNRCIYLGTPALQSFKLRLTLDDLQELLDSVFKASGMNRTTRKRSISGSEMSDLVETVEKMIEMKKSKIKIKFSPEELQGMADIINKKLQE